MHSNYLYNNMHVACMVKDCQTCSAEGVLKCDMCKLEMVLSPDKLTCSST